ncbi:hypothetical protein DQ04_18231000, partial [Trypanosoma grayi]|uniref:hypothetical protein n=1 Tax=Trypanosoma grayi TaxID=71804 RepID=UPI0004F4159F
MYEYDDQQMKEEVQQAQAAAVIQRRWREFFARREEDVELRRGKASVAAAAAAAAAAAVAEESGRESGEAEPEALLHDYTCLLERREDIVARSLMCQRQLARHFAAQRQRKGEEPPQS